MTITKIALACRISRGGFSDERVFEIDTPDGVFSGVVSRRYCWGPNDQLLEEGEPPLGETISGKIAAKVIEFDEATRTLLVSVPDGQVITVGASAVLIRPGEVGINVPVGS